MQVVGSEGQAQARISDNNYVHNYVHNYVQFRSRLGHECVANKWAVHCPVELECELRRSSSLTRLCQPGARHANVKGCWFALGGS